MKVAYICLLLASIIACGQSERTYTAFNELYLLEGTKTSFEGFIAFLNDKLPELRELKAIKPS